MSIGRVMWYGSIALGVIIAAPQLRQAWQSSFSKTKEVAISHEETQNKRRVAKPQCTDLPCPLTVAANGSTEVVHVPPGIAVCFSQSFFTDIERLGFRVAYGNGPERVQSCANTGNGQCKVATYDRFRFVPEEGVPVPEYWFVPYGSSSC